MPATMDVKMNIVSDGSAQAGYELENAPARAGGYDGRAVGAVCCVLHACDSGVKMVNTC